jgi:hypothetical protein
MYQTPDSETRTAKEISLFSIGYWAENLSFITLEISISAGFFIEKNNRMQSGHHYMKVTVMPRLVQINYNF